MIVRLSAWVRKDEFKETYGFDIADIKRLVALARDTGRIQFALTDIPTRFRNLDYLEQIFTELRTPCMITLPYESFADQQLLQNYIVEFYSLANIRFIPHFREAMFQEGINADQQKGLFRDFERDYVMLKAFGYTEVIDTINDALVTDIDEAVRLFNVYGNLLTEPKVTPFNAIYTFSLQEIEEYGKIPENLQPSGKQLLPSEIGSFLFKKISLFPENYQACIDVIGKYEQEDLMKVFSSLVDAVKSKNIDLTLKNSEATSTILDNVWQDASTLSKRAKIIEYGTLVNLALIGGLAGTLLQNPAVGASAGFLLGLGLDVADKVIENNSGSFTGRLAKIGEPNYLSLIYDFRKEHLLKK